MKKILFALGLCLALAFLYLSLAPIPIEPVAWHAPENPGYVDEYAVNDELGEYALGSIDLGEYSGPEDIVMGPDGWLYVSVHEGKILQINPETAEIKVFVKDLGRPLGLHFDANGNLIVADAYLGVLRFSPEGVKEVLVDQVDSRPLVYANNLAISKAGLIYFSEASYKFGAKQYGGSYPASLLDLMEHCACGSVWVYDPSNRSLANLVKGLHFANGIALSNDETSLYINETGGYKTYKFDLATKQLSDHAGAYPGFPDNLSRGLKGKYWLGLVSPRNKMLDAVSDKPFFRAMIQRMPASIRPKATYYSHIVAFNDAGEIVANLQSPAGFYPTNTGVLETPERLYIASLTADIIAYVDL